MSSSKLKEHQIGINQQFASDLASCDFEKIMCLGPDLNIKGRYADI